MKYYDDDDYGSREYTRMEAEVFGTGSKGQLARTAWALWKGFFRKRLAIGVMVELMFSRSFFSGQL